MNANHKLQDTVLLTTNMSIQMKVPDCIHVRWAWVAENMRPHMAFV